MNTAFPGQDKNVKHVFQLYILKYFKVGSTKWPLQTTCNECTPFVFLVLRGYLIAQDGSACVDTSSGSGVVDPVGVTQDAAGLSTVCSLLSLKDGVTAGLSGTALYCCIRPAIN